MDNQPANTIRIVILEKYILPRCGLRLLLASQSRLKVVGDIGNLDQALEVLEAQKPDIILLNSSFTADLGMEIIPKLIKASEKARIIFITNADDPRAYVPAIQAGVLGLVFGTQAPEVLYKAIEKVHSGEVWIERSMFANIITGLVSANKLDDANPETARIAQLSNREREVIQLIGLGMKNQRIASQLSISETTVRHHLTSIFNKLGVSDRLELLVFAHEWGLVKTSEKSQNPNEADEVFLFRPLKKGVEV